MASQVTNLLAPYLPPPYLAAVSAGLSGLERLVLPSLRAVQYTFTTLDPDSILPLVISLVTLYLTLLSFWYTARVGIRIAWFVVKWGAIAAVVWLLVGGHLGSLNLTAQGSASVHGPSPIGQRGGQWWAEWSRHKQGASASTYRYSTGAAPGSPASPDSGSAFGDRFSSLFARGPSGPRPAGTTSGEQGRRRKDVGSDASLAGDFAALRRVGGMLSRMAKGSVPGRVGRQTSTDASRGPTRNR